MCWSAIASGVQDIAGKPNLSAAPPFGLTDLRAAIPDECWEKNTLKSFSYLIKDVAIVLGLAAAAYSLNTWCASTDALPSAHERGTNSGFDRSDDAV